MGPQASKMSPRASKITQNHENMVTQNQENPRKKTSRNGTVAGNARSALDTIITHPLYPRIAQNCIILMSGHFCIDSEKTIS